MLSLPQAFWEKRAASGNLAHFSFYDSYCFSFTECGSGFTVKLEGMFKDMELSKDIMLAFKQVTFIMIW